MIYPPTSVILFTATYIRSITMLPFSLPVCLALVSLVVATPQPIHRRANSTSDEIGLLSNGRYFSISKLKPKATIN